MPRILIVAATTGYQMRAFRDAAFRLGFDVTLATDRCHVLENPWGDNAIPVRFDEAEESAVELARATRGAKIDGIVAVADKPAVVAAMAARHLEIPWHPPEAALACRNKRRMRELFQAAGLRVPRYALAEEYAGAFPCVLKPAGMSASRGVIRADNAAEYSAALRRIRAIAGKESAVLAEEYIPGSEFALEGLMTFGELRILAIFDKPDPLEGPFFEETIYVTPSREPARVQAEIVKTCSQAALALGLWHGPIHAEMRVNEHGVYMLEIAARPIGGLCARAIRFGVTLEELILLHAVGRTPEELKPFSPASGVMMIPVPGKGVLRSVRGIDAARAVAHVDDVIVTAKTGEMLIPLPEGASYPGFIFASGPDPASVEYALRAAHCALHFEILATLPIA